MQNLFCDQLARKGHRSHFDCRILHGDSLQKKGAVLIF